MTYKAKLMERLKAALAADPEHTLTKMAAYSDPNQFTPISPGRAAAYSRGYRQGQADTARMIIDLLEGGE